MGGCRRLGQIAAALNRIADLNAGKRTSRRDLLLIGGEQSYLATPEADADSQDQSLSGYRFTSLADDAIA